MVINLYLKEADKIHKVLIESFLKTFVSYMLADGTSSDVLSLLTSETFPTDEQGTRLISQIRKSFRAFLKENVHDLTGIQLSSSEIEELLEQMGINILSSVKDMEENGNSWYWFSHSGQFINQ